MNRIEMSIEQLAGFMAPPEGETRKHEGEHRDHAWWKEWFLDLFRVVLEKYKADGLMALENHLLDSSKLGSKFVLPFGGSATYPEVPEHPFSIDGTASGTVCVVGVYRHHREDSTKGE